MLNEIDAQDSGGRQSTVARRLRSIFTPCRESNSGTGIRNRCKWL